jgi:forkhead transcription factor HCM1
MALTCQPPPLQIYQDPLPPPPPITAMQKPKPQLQPSAIPLQPIKNPQSQRDVNIQPPHSAPPHPSPSKAFHIPSPPLPGHPDFAHVSIPPPSQNSYTDSLVKDQIPVSMPPRPYLPPISQRPLFTTFPSAPMEPLDKENYHHVPSDNENFADFPDPSYARNRPLKRSLSEISSFDRPFNRLRQQDEQVNHLPEPEEMPPVEDEGTKPSHSYANLIGMAILRAPNRRLTLAQIYKWISDSYSFYRGSETGWQNSIRHNLSLNKAFQKQERPKGDSGKGNYWTIAPGMELQFVKEKPTRKGTAVANLSVQPQIIRHEAPTPLADALAPQKWLGPPPPRPQTARPQTARPQTAPELPELSSDATLPASDPALQEDEGTAFDRNTHARHPQSSPQAMNSSPPMPAPLRRRRDTTSPIHMMQPSSGPNRKRKSGTMDDSGYFSSLESSVLRPNNPAAVVLTSELDAQRPKKKKRGRAEEEIARIRSSSHDLTPSHLRFRSLGSDELMLSSPLRGADYTKLGPVTPAMMFKKPARPPPSISPNTHLRNHRQQVQELVNSPSRTLAPGQADELAWSPYFKLNNAGLDIYSDLATTPSTPAMGSPLKRSAKRPLLSRAFSTPNNALQDISNTNTRINAKTPSKLSMLKPSTKFTPKSPSKVIDSLLPPETEDFFNFGVFDDENDDEANDGVDILQGFQKIGVVPPPKQLSPPTKAKTPRPALARSSTTRF